MADNHFNEAHDGDEHQPGPNEEARRQLNGTRLQRLHVDTGNFVAWCNNRHGNFPGVNVPLPDDQPNVKYRWPLLDVFRFDIRFEPDWGRWSDDNINVDLAALPALNHDEYNRVWNDAKQVDALEDNVVKFVASFFRAYLDLGGAVWGGNQHCLPVPVHYGQRRRKIIPDAYYYRGSRLPNEADHERRTWCVCVEVKRLEAACQRNGVANAITQTLVQCVVAAVKHMPRDADGRFTAGSVVQVVGITILATEKFFFHKLGITAELLRHLEQYGGPPHTMPRFRGDRTAVSTHEWVPPAGLRDADGNIDFSNHEVKYSFAHHIDTVLAEMEHNADAE